MSAVDAEDLEVLSTRNIDLLAREEALYIKINRIALSAVVVLLFAVFALGATYWASLPLRRLDTAIVAYDMEGHIFQRVHDDREMADKDRQAMVLQTLWLTVWNCRGYLWHGAPDRYHICSELTAERAQKEFQAWFNRAETSPQRQIGETGHIDPYEDANSAEIKGDLETCQAKKGFCEAGLSFWEITKRDAEATPVKRHYTAYFAFIFVDRIDPQERVQFNPTALKVIDIRYDCDSGNCEVP